MMETGLDKRKALFGGNLPWDASDWTASDDRVRGGKSQSYLSISEGTATFNGNLDIQTLGGAGFASQRTTGENRKWDLSEYAGIELMISDVDDKQYTFILKDEILPRDPNTGREQSTISYEYDFKIPSPELRNNSAPLAIFVPWIQLKATYRGKEKIDAAPIRVECIRRMSLMMRSFFGSQDGDFSLTLLSITASTSTACPEAGPDDGIGSEATKSCASSQDLAPAGAKRSEREAAASSEGFFSWLLSRYWKL